MTVIYGFIWLYSSFGYKRKVKRQGCGPPDIFLFFQHLCLHITWQTSMCCLHLMETTLVQHWRSLKTEEQNCVMPKLAKFGSGWTIQPSYRMNIWCYLLLLCWWLFWGSKLSPVMYYLVQIWTWESTDLQLERQTIRAENIYVTFSTSTPFKID